MNHDTSREARIDRMHRLRDRVVEWAAKHRRQVLLDGIRCWNGPHDGEEQLARQGVAFALLTPGADGRAPFEAFADAAGKLPRRDRVVIDAWRGTWFGESAHRPHRGGRGPRVRAQAPLRELRGS